MSTQNWQDSFKELCLSIFGFLVTDYNYEYVETKKIGFGIYSRFINQNTKTKVEIWYDLRDNDPDIIIAKYSKNVDELNSVIRLWELLSLTASSIKHINRYNSNQPPLDYAKQVFIQYSNELKQYGKDVLMGDFSILPTITNNNRQQMKMIQQEYGIVLTEEFVNSFEEICKKSFKFLLDKYSFVFSNITVERNSIVSCIFKNSTTAVIVFCDTQLIPPIVSYEVIRLVNGQILDWSNPSFSIDDRVSFSALNLFNDNKELFSSDRSQREDFDSTQAYLIAELNYYANNLEKYGQDVLLGDFSKVKKQKEELKNAYNNYYKMKE